MEQQTSDHGAIDADVTRNWRTQARRRLVEKFLPTPEFLLTDEHISMDSQMRRHERSQEILLWLMERDWTHTMTIQFGEFIDEPEIYRRSKIIINFLRHKIAGRRQHMTGAGFWETSSHGKGHAHWLLDILTIRQLDVPATTERLYGKMFPTHRETERLSPRMMAVSCQMTAWAQAKGLVTGTIQVGEIADTAIRMQAYASKSLLRSYADPIKSQNIMLV